MTRLADSSERMQCMEVWGGNSPADRHFTTPGLELWLRSCPYRDAERGGDVYFVSSCASGRITRLLLADVSGHGAQAASLALRLRELMRRNVNVISQTRLAREINQQFATQAADDRFATALVCTFFAPTGSLQFCNAGHPTPLIFRSDDNAWHSAQDGADVEHAEGLADIPLGVVEQTDYSVYRTTLKLGDMVLCVSDAFTESTNVDGNLLGIEGLCEIVRSLDHRSYDTFVDDLVQRIGQLHPGNLRQDDATVIMFRADGSRVSLGSNLAAPLRLFASVRDTTNLRFDPGAD